MSESFLVELLVNNPSFAIVISLFASVVVAILGVVPSFFITLANVSVFGVFGGFLLSVAGEALGAVVSFALYRKGLKEVSSGLLDRYSKLKSLVNCQEKQAFMLVLSARLLPFFPSGIITYAAAIGKMSIVTFFIASTVGKIPALAIEVVGSMSVVYAARSGYFSVLVGIVGVGIIFFTIKKRGKNG